MTSQTGNQIILILLSISRSKGNQAMKFVQLIEYNMRNIFLKKNHTQNAMKKLATELFLQYQKLSISLDQQCKMFSSLFVLYVQVEGFQKILKLRY